MGYTHDPNVKQFIPPTNFSFTAGTWTPTLTSNVVTNVRGAAAATCGVFIPIPIPSNASNKKGSYLASIDVWYTIGTAALNALATVELEKIALTANGAAVTGSAPAVTQDANNNTSALRLALGDHTMNVALTTPVWIGQNDAYVLYLYLDCAATSVVTFKGARANYTERM
jgi:hypothetical protein